MTPKADVVVVGATGVLGQTAVREILARGLRVRCLVRDLDKARRVLPTEAQCIHGDLWDAEALLAAMDGVETVCHLATAIPRGPAAARPEAWAENDRIRRAGTAAILGTAVRAGAAHVLLQSVTLFLAAGGERWLNEEAPLADPLPERLRSAWDMEELGRSAAGSGSLGVTILRGARFYGPGTGSTEQLVEELRSGSRPVIGDGRNFLSWLHVEDMAQGVALAVLRPTPPGRWGQYHIADESPVRQGDFLRSLACHLGGPLPAQVSLEGARERYGSVATAAWTTSHRISAQRIQKDMGLRLRYPSWREGFASWLGVLETSNFHIQP